MRSEERASIAAIAASMADDIASVLSGVVFPSGISASLAASVSKAVPVMGQTVGVVTSPALSGAITYAIGKVFNQHFASGGTFLTFDPDKVKAYYAEMFKEGKKVAADIRKEKKESVQVFGCS